MSKTKQAMTDFLAISGLDKTTVRKHQLQFGECSGEEGHSKAILKGEKTSFGREHTELRRFAPSP